MTPMTVDMPTAPHVAITDPSASNPWHNAWTKPGARACACGLVGDHWEGTT